MKCIVILGITREKRSHSVSILSNNVAIIQIIFENTV